jgi:two-component system chemotaxis response regulator CheB
MLMQKLIVIGGSAGALEALLTILGGLPAELPAAVLVVMHLPPHSKSRLPEILSRAGPLPAALARDGDLLQRGRVYVAPPDFHLLVRRDHLELGRGPRENHARPSIDPCLRTAARHYGPNLMAVVLSGTQDDGTLGLMAVRARGGVCVVQDPDDAVFSSMPTNAIEAGVADQVLPAADIARMIVTFAKESKQTAGVRPMKSEVELAPDIIAQDIADQENGNRHGMTATFTCPDCGGVLWQVNEGKVYHFFCHLGHSFGPNALLALQTEELEAALWTAVRALREKTMLLRQMANHAREAGNVALAERLSEQASGDEASLQLIRDSLLGGAESPITAKQDLDQQAPKQREEERPEPSG